MSGTRPPNKQDSEIESSKETTSSSAENEERQKKLKSDQPTSQATVSFSGLDSTPPSVPVPAYSSTSNTTSRAASSFPFVPRQINMAKRKSDSSVSTTNATTVSSSNSLISNLLARAQPVSHPSSVEVYSTSSTVEDKTIPKPPGYLLLEKQFAQLGDIAKPIAPLAGKSDKDDIDIYAISFGFILLSETLDDIKKSYASYFNNHAKQLGIDYGFTTKFTNFEHTLTAIKDIRNGLADHFIRIPQIKKFSSFNSEFILEDNFNKLATLNKDNIATTQPLPSKMLPQITRLAQRLDEINLKPVSYADRLGFLISSLKRINEIKQLPGDYAPYQSQAIAMLFIIAGTCARELAFANKDSTLDLPTHQKHNSAEKLTKFFETADGKACLEIFKDLNIIRKDLAHNNDAFRNDLRKPDALKKVVDGVDETKLIARIKLQEANIVKILDQEYKPRPIIPIPPIPTAELVETNLPSMKR